MQDNDKLTGLIEQAALAVNMLNPADMSGIESLQAVLDQVKKTVDEASDLPPQILELARGKSSDAAGIIEKILNQKVKNSAQSIQLLSQMVTDLQGLITEITKDKIVPDQPQNPPPAKDVSVMPQGAQIISQEDLPFIQDFTSEANEHIGNGEAGLLELENKPGDNETLNLIFRAFHTIKGMAGFLNLTEIGSLAHSAENLLDLARKGEMVLAGKTTDVVFESIDVMKKMIASLKTAVETGKPVAKYEQLPALITKLKTVAENKGFVTVSERAGEDAKLDAILKSGDQTAGDTGERAKTRLTDETIKVNTTRLDNLINMVGELVIAQLMISEDVKETLSTEQSLGRKVAHQSKIVRELQELSMSMRMVPISGVFQKMTRLVRDLSHKSGKNVNLSISGEDTELDRNIVDKIADPLVHMIRNSVDHGIESPEERVKTGKDAVGHLKLRAFHQSGNIVIEIEDDGKGLNKERILKKAVENGIVSPDQQLSEQEIFKLIYHAGLSTAEKVTSVSGRGVGMDVVRKNVESLRGRIDISSVTGRGTTFTIRLPLTLAIIDGQVMKVGTERYIVPINSIIQSFRPTAGQVSTVQAKGDVVMVRGELLPLVRLYRLFNIESSIDDPTKALLVMVEEDSKKCCLLVDELLGQQQVVIKSLGDGLGKVKGVSGGAIMGDGKVSLILDVQGLMQLAQS